MYESSVMQHFIEQGMREEALEVLIEILEFRFPPDEVQPLKPTLESIEELQQLRQLRHHALRVSSLDDFRRILSL